MKKILIVLFSTYLLVGCAVTTSHKYNSSNTSNEMNGTELSSELFTYSLDPSRLQPLIEIIFTGKFLKKDGCLLFQVRDELFTPVFPSKATKYKDGDNNIIVGNRVFNIGQEFDLSVLNPVKIGANSFSFDAIGRDYCLMESILPIQLY